MAFIDDFRDLPAELSRRLYDYIKPLDEESRHGSGIRLLINGDDWIKDLLFNHPQLKACPSNYIVLDEVVRQTVEHIRSFGFTLAVFFVNTGLDWVHSHYKLNDIVLRREYADTALGQALSIKVLPILAVNQLYCTLVDLGVPVHGGHFRRNRELIDSIQPMANHMVLLTDMKNCVWLINDISVVHFSDLYPPYGKCVVWNCHNLLKFLMLNRPQFLELLALFSVLRDPSFHKGILRMPRHVFDTWMSEVDCADIVSVAKWLSYQDRNFRFGSPMPDINEKMNACRTNFLMLPPPQLPDIVWHFLALDRLDSHYQHSSSSSGSEDPRSLGGRGGRDSGGALAAKWQFPVPGYGYVLPFFFDLFPRLEHKLKEHAVRSKGNGRAIPVIALR